MKKNQTLVTFVVIIVALGLVAAYIPSFFLSSSPQPQFPEQIPVLPPENLNQTTTETGNEPSTLPEGLQGLEEESKSLDGILN